MPPPTGFVVPFCCLLSSNFLFRIRVMLDRYSLRNGVRRRAADSGCLLRDLTALCLADSAIRAGHQTLVLIVVDDAIVRSVFLEAHIANEADDEEKDEHDQCCYEECEVEG